jgi:hypothetical protein
LPLKVGFEGSCPKCGNKKKFISLKLFDRITFKETLTSEFRREYLKENIYIKWTLIMITLTSLILGFFITGTTGVILGLVIGILTYLIGPYAVLRVRETIISK